MQKAIICLETDQNTLIQIEKVIIENFGQAYVTEIVQNKAEALEVMKTLSKIKIDTAVFITNIDMHQADGLELISTINKLDKKTKILLYANFLDPVSTEEIINSRLVYKIVYKSLSEMEMIQMIEEACLTYQQETDVENLYTQLKESENVKKLILESISEGMCLIDEHYDLKWMNHTIRREFCQNRESTDLKCYQLFYNRVRPCRDCPTQNVLMGLKSHCEIRKYENDVYKQVTYYPVQSEAKKNIGILMSFTDITNGRKVEKMKNVLLKVATSVNNCESILQLYQHIYEIIVEDLFAKYMCVAGKDFDDVYIEYLNGKDKLISCKKLKTKEYEHLLNLMESLRGQIKSDVHNNYLITEMENEVEIAMSIHDKVMIFVFENDDMSIDYLLTFVKSLSEQIKTGITKIESIKKITYQAHHDSLTGLYNREFFMKTVNNKIFTKREGDHETSSYSLAVLDLNYFKEVNDSYGHVIGDEVLLTVSQRILKTLRHGDMVARIGGDEFAILLQLGSKTEITKILKRVQELIAEPIIIGKEAVEIGSSIGLVYEVGKYTHSELAIIDADKAMYEAKRDKSGFGTCRFFEKDIEEKLQYQNNIKTNLKSAMLNREFSLRYQPIVSLVEEKVIGFEAFIRWESKQGTFLSPSEFIPIAEESGEIEAIGNFVLDEVAIAIGQLNDDLDECYVSINFSSKQLFSNQQIERIEGLGLLTKQIQIEVTEKTLVENHDKANKGLERLQKMGIKIHLDDFGTGYSSLVFLNTTDINDIKIDGTFIKQLPQNENCKKIIKIILAMAQGLGMTVTAEGVETKEQWDFLKSEGCDFVQGYFISEPLTLQEAIKFKKCQFVF